MKKFCMMLGMNSHSEDIFGLDKLIAETNVLDISSLGPATFTSVEIEAFGAVSLDLAAVYTGSITSPETLKIKAQIVGPNGGLTDATYKDDSSSSLCRLTGTLQTCSNVYDVKRIIVGLEPSTTYRIRMYAEYDGQIAGANNDQTETTGKDSPKVRF